MNFSYSNNSSSGVSSESTNVKTSLKLKKLLKIIKITFQTVSVKRVLEITGLNPTKKVVVVELSKPLYPTLFFDRRLVESRT